MSNAHSGSTYRRRLGRSPSPPTWLWYEQIPFADDSSESDGDVASEYESCSEDDEDYNARQHEREHHQNENHSSSASDSGSDVQHERPIRGEASADSAGVDGAGDADDMDVEDEKHGKGKDAKEGCGEGEVKKDVKGKQRAVDPPDVETTNESTKRRERRKKQRKPVYTFRPILTIQKSQGFVWNQVCCYSLIECMYAFPHFRRLYSR